MIKVMIVDDEPFIRQGLKILIKWEQYGFEICGEAANGKEASELMKNDSFDLVITDIKMPLMDGLELIEYTYHHISKAIRFIILSGFYEFNYAKKAIKYDVADYVLKPVQREELIKALEDYKENYFLQAENLRKLKYSGKIIFDRYLANLIEGKFDKESCEYVSEVLSNVHEVRYISIDFDPIEDVYNNLTEEEKSKAQSTLYNSLKEYLGKDWYHAYMEVNYYDMGASVGFIYTDKLANDSGLNEKDYLIRLYKNISMLQPLRVILFIGQKKEHIESIGDSFKTAAIARSFQNFNRDKSMVYYDDIKGKIGTSKQLVHKEHLDDLIRAIEEYNLEKIDSEIDILYGYFKELLMEPTIIRINLYYILFQIINIAKDLDPNFEQEDIYKKINQKEYDNLSIFLNIKLFKQFILEFSTYLSSLRLHVCCGVLGEIEKEITEHYMENLTLKSMSEKYYINSAYLGQIFKKQFGNSFKEYLNTYRIERAAELLIRSDKKIYLIASSVGFNNTDYFINKFVQMKGLTPYQYRKQSISKPRGVV